MPPVKCLTKKSLRAKTSNSRIVALLIKPIGRIVTAHSIWATSSAAIAEAIASRLGKLKLVTSASQARKSKKAAITTPRYLAKNHSDLLDKKKITNRA